MGPLLRNVQPPVLAVGIVSAHSTSVNEILRKAGIDWPVDGIPSIDKPIITINLAIN